MGNLNKLVDFLITAKKNTYAAKAAEVDPSRPGSHDLHFNDGIYSYIDTYLGGEMFAGEEAVWEYNKPVWAMNYAGRLLADGFSGDFLKAALMRVPKGKPYRGPGEYVDGEYIYKCTVEGDFGWFSGSEDIFKNNIKVYECVFHGGIIK